MLRCWAAVLSMAGGERGLCRFIEGRLCPPWRSQAVGACRSRAYLVMADIETRAKQHTLGELVEPASRRVLNPESLSLYGGLCADAPVLVILAAGKGTRFGHEPKCIQPVHGTPLARHSIDAFRRFSSSPVICLVGYRHQQVAAALGADVTYFLSDDPAGGTA